MKRFWNLGTTSTAILAALAVVLVALRPARAGEPTDWLHQARWGVMTHYLAAPPGSEHPPELAAELWNKQVDEFDASRFANQLAEIGTKYLLFTIGQNSGHYCAPNATYDRLVGIAPSKCSRRDLVADLAKALARRNIRLMIYMPNSAPACDRVARKKLGWLWGQPGDWQLPGEPVGGRLVDFQRKWETVIREWSLRWGKKVSGWWIDGCYFADKMYRFDDEPNFASFARALKAGNPDAIVAFNPGVFVPVICHTKYDDYTAGETNLPQLPQVAALCPGRWIQREGHRAQFHILTFLGTDWCEGQRPQWPDDKLVKLTRQVVAKGGVVTYDVPIQKSGLISQPFAEQLRAIGQAMAIHAQEPHLAREFYEWANIWIPEATGTKLPRVLLIGDSITQAYSQPVADKLQGKASVARLTTSKSIGDPALLAEVALVLGQCRFDVVHFNNGLHGWGYSESDYREHFPELIAAIRKHAPKAKLIWATTTPVRTAKDLSVVADNTKRVQARNKIAQEIVSKERILVDDLYGLVKDHPEYWSADGVHFNAKGVAVEAEQVAKRVLESLKH
jgi:hypothetical protein